MVVYALALIRLYEQAYKAALHDVKVHAAKENSSQDDLMENFFTWFSTLVKLFR